MSNFALKFRTLLLIGGGFRMRRAPARNSPTSLTRRARIVVWPRLPKGWPTSFRTGISWAAITALTKN